VGHRHVEHLWQVTKAQQDVLKKQLARPRFSSLPLPVRQMQLQVVAQRLKIRAKVNGAGGKWQVVCVEAGGSVRRSSLLQPLVISFL
jgi:hypothetical protein